MGPNTTAGNADQLMSVTGSINGMPESANYTYDQYGRLVTSSETTNVTNTQRRFAYDRWGNRTGVWNLTSGGTQIQSITLQLSNGVPTNRIQSVTQGGGTVNYSYDAAGNVTSDGLHTYTYDAENRIATVDGAALYLYDHQNRRVRNYYGSGTYYIWEGWQVLAEHSVSGGGAVLVDYIYANNQMIAKEDGQRKFFVRDRLSIRGITTGYGSFSTQSHMPYGQDRVMNGEQEKHRFTTYERDMESGTDYAVNRQYSSSVGRFLQADPVPQTAAGCATDNGGGRQHNQPNTPLSWHPYSYSLADPVNKTDPLGLWPCEPWLYSGYVWWDDPWDFPFDPLLAFILCNPIALITSPFVGFLFGRCDGTTDCSFYDTMCEIAKKHAEKDFTKVYLKLYYCEAAPRACKAAGNSALSNCIRLCLQDKERTYECYLQIDSNFFAGCEVKIHAACVSRCALACLLCYVEIHGWVNVKVALGSSVEGPALTRAKRRRGVLRLLDSL